MIKILSLVWDITAVENISNLKYADETTLIAESEEELKSLWTRVKEKSENSGLKPNMENLRSGHPVSSLHGKQKEGKVEAVTDFLFGGLQNAHGW